MWKFKLERNQRLYFTSDTHYNHKNICRGVTEWRTPDGSIPVDRTRNFRSLEHMNSTIVEGINSTVGQDDILIHLGDWSFGGFDFIQEFRNQLVCKNIYLVLGNHDHHIKKNKDNIQSLFCQVEKVEDVQIRLVTHPIFGPDPIYDFILSHHPYYSWDHMRKGAIHLFGHVHLPADKKIMKGRSMDVGVEGNNFKPYEVREIIKLLQDRPIRANQLPYDHHEQV